ncbi:MAG: hypothetical protein AAF633_01225 [Chloroflexota bacterium]
MLVIPPTSRLYALFNELAQTKRCVFFAGLPGTGKSLYIQQMATIAAQNGRRIYLLQWDVSRMAFETAEVITKYPEIDGVTDPAIRKAVGLWSRQGVLRWHEAHSDPSAILIGETPLVGNRLIELAQPINDAAETLLGSKATQFIVPVPSTRVRRIIEEARAKSIANPAHEKEKKDAPPNVLRLNWQDAYDAAVDLKIAEPNEKAPYDPTIYGEMYRQVLINRQTEILLIDDIFEPTSTVYDIGAVEGELSATSKEVEKLIGEVEAAYSRPELFEAVNSWHKHGINSI